MRTAVRLLLLAAAGLALAVLPSGAQAHAVLVSSTPADGSTVAAAPRTVVLRFDENVRLVPRTARVVADAGTFVDTGHARADGRDVEIPLENDVPDGRYTATWRVVSADGHVVEGSVRFGVGVAVSATGGRAGGGASFADVTYDVASGAGAFALPLCLGVPLVSWLGSTRLARRRRRLAASGAGVAVVLAVLALVADQIRGGGPTTHTGAMLLLRAGAALALVGVLFLPRTVRWLVGAPVAAGLVLSHAWIGHASVGAGVWWAVPVAMVHVAAMSVWLGGLVVLVVETAAGSRALPLLGRWSWWAGTCVALIVVTGVLQGLRQVHPLGSLWHTTYGLLLVGKVLFVGLAVLTALATRRVLALRGFPRGTPAVLATEVLLLVVVLGVTTDLVAQPPARETYGPARTVQAPLGRDRLEVRVDTTRRGPTELHVRGLSASGRSVPIRTLDGSLSAPGVAALQVRFVPDGSGRWTARPVVPRPATWRLTMQVGLSADLGYATSVRYRVW